MIAAGFLHDVVEDTDVTIEELEQRFWSEVRQLVEGVTKLSLTSPVDREPSREFRRMFLAMAQDIRVIVKAGRSAAQYANTRTLVLMKTSPNCPETRDIFAPLANRLGMGALSNWKIWPLSTWNLKLIVRCRTW